MHDTLLIIVEAMLKSMSRLCFPLQAGGLKHFLSLSVQVVVLYIVELRDDVRHKRAVVFV